MKKLFLVIFILFLLTISQGISFAQNVNSGVSNQPIQYDLPYPGILPDSPLYFLKAIRDNVINLFITDPLKKSEYDLLMSDKRLASAQILLNEKKANLAITTLSKSRNYFFQATQHAANAKKQGEDALPILNKLLQASKKHQEVILQMVQQSKGETRVGLDLLGKGAKLSQKSIELLDIK
jgi:hypothetical protein